MRAESESIEPPILAYPAHSRIYVTSWRAFYKEIRQYFNIMNKYILNRIIQLAPLLFIAISINFVLIRLAPGDPIDYLLSDPDAPVGYAEELKKIHGLDKPIHIQFIIYMKYLL